MRSVAYKQGASVALEKLAAGNKAFPRAVQAVKRMFGNYAPTEGTRQLMAGQNTGAGWRDMAQTVLGGAPEKLTPRPSRLVDVSYGLQGSKAPARVISDALPTMRESLLPLEGPMNSAPFGAQKMFSPMSVQDKALARARGLRSAVEKLMQKRPDFRLSDAGYQQLARRPRP